MIQFGSLSDFDLVLLPNPFSSSASFLVHLLLLPLVFSNYTSIRLVYYTLNTPHTSKQPPKKESLPLISIYSQATTSKKIFFKHTKKCLASTFNLPPGACPALQPSPNSSPGSREACAPGANPDGRVSKITALGIRQ